MYHVGNCQPTIGFVQNLISWPEHIFPVQLFTCDMTQRQTVFIGL